ncbi:MAG TPA: hypothetical protein VMN82_09350 [Thermoanaerobaculia bacterium]|nr:hypothetical protein [Thermoanaerobaculia bacterium]
MKLSRQALLVAAVAAGMTSIAAAADSHSEARGSVSRLTPRLAAQPKAGASSYSVEVPYVQSYQPADSGQSGTLVLNSSHPFDITLVATDQHHNNITGAGVALPQTDTFGYFSLPSLTQNPSNPEVFVKILDATAAGGGYWVFYGHLTDLIYDLTVKDVTTGQTQTYHKDAGNEPGGFDTTTFPAASTSSAPSSARKAARVISPDAFLRTSVDISNNTGSVANAVMQYCYSTGGAFQGCTPQRPVALPAFSNFHQDDLVGYLGSLGDLPPAAVQDSIGTLLVTFNNLPSGVGWEGTVAANVYNRVSEVDPLRGTVGCGEQVSYFFESATVSLVGTARWTVPAPSAQAGSIASTLGVRNTDASGSPAPATVDAVVTLYDPTSGLPVGNQIPLTAIAPGELRLVDDLFSAAGVPTNVTTAIVFVDVTNPTQTSPTIEGFIIDQDTDSLDTRFHEMKCAGGCF